MSYQVVIPVIIAFVISAALAPVVIPFLRKLKVGQTERKELEIASEEDGNADDGRDHHSCSGRSYQSYLY